MLCALLANSQRHTHTHTPCVCATCEPQRPTNRPARRSLRNGSLLWPSPQPLVASAAAAAAAGTRSSNLSGGGCSRNRPPSLAIETSTQMGERIPLWTLTHPAAPVVRAYDAMQLWIRVLTAPMSLLPGLCAGRENLLAHRFRATSHSWGSDH